MDSYSIAENSAVASIRMGRSSVGIGEAITGVGDFNGDGGAGILWRAIAGHEVIWSLEGTTIASYGEIY